ncbi:MAG: hypothetical protein ACK5Y2_08865 [Bdellovibrionales bacterium]
MDVKNKSMRSRLWPLALLVALTISSSCSQKIGEEELGSDGGGGTGGNTNQNALASQNTPLFFYIQTKPADGAATATRTYWGTCEIDPANLAANNIACTISIPEAILYYGDTVLTVGTNNSSLCPRVNFQPYFRRLTNVSFTPLGASAAVDCSANPVPVECYDGAARYIVPNFPNFVGIWFWTVTATSNEFVVDAPFGTSSFGNTRICNNLAVGSRGANQSIGGYPTLLANTFQDYVVSCRDQFENTLYQVTITIEDYDRDNIPNDPGFNEFYDWN